MILSSSLGHGHLLLGACGLTTGELCNPCKPLTQNSSENFLPTDSTGKQDRYGWDFISGDPRPADDGYHGTAMASLILSQAPNARIMPLKVFNPWGVTRSAALFEAFRYAVDNGADLILASWSTRRKTASLDEAIAYAQTRAVPVIAAAGDLNVSIRQVATYPASLAYKYDNILSVAALDKNGLLWKNSNYDSILVHVATRGTDFTVAAPRAKTSQMSSTDVAAARTAGFVARLMMQTGQKINIHALIASLAKSDPRLKSQIHDGLVLEEVLFVPPFEK